MSGGGREPTTLSGNATKRVRGTSRKHPFGPKLFVKCLLNTGPTLLGIVGEMKRVSCI